MPLPPSRVLRIFRYAMYFNGVNAYVLVPYNRVFDVGNSGQLTIAVFVEYVPVLARWHGVVTKNRENSDQSYWYGIFISGSVPYFYHFRFSTSAVNTIPASTTSFDYVELKMTTTYAEGYVNLVKRASLNAIIKDATYPLYIGRAGGVSEFFSGFIRSVYIYSKWLTNDESAQNYNYPDNPVRNGLVLWLQADPQYVKDIDGDGVLEWVDLSGFNNHGKIYGAQLVQLIKTPARMLTPARVLKPAR